MDFPWIFHRLATFLPASTDRNVQVSCRRMDPSAWMTWARVPGFPITVGQFGAGLLLLYKQYSYLSIYMIYDIYIYMI